LLVTNRVLEQRPECSIQDFVWKHVKLPPYSANFFLRDLFQYRVYSAGHCQFRKVSKLLEVWWELTDVLLNLDTIDVSTILQLHNTVYGTRQVPSACHNILRSCTPYRLVDILLVIQGFLFFFYRQESPESKNFIEYNIDRFILFIWSLQRIDSYRIPLDESECPRSIHDRAFDLRHPVYYL